MILNVRNGLIILILSLAANLTSTFATVQHDNSILGKYILETVFDTENFRVFDPRSIELKADGTFSQIPLMSPNKMFWVPPRGEHGTWTYKNNTLTLTPNKNPNSDSDSQLVLPLFVNLNTLIVNKVKEVSTSLKTRVFAHAKWYLTKISEKAPSWEDQMPLTSSPATIERSHFKTPISLFA